MGSFWGGRKESLYYLKVIGNMEIPQALSARITGNQETALHIATGATYIVFVQEFVNIMTPDDLALQNTASGINKNRKLASIRDSEGATPLCMAALLGHREMVWCLYSITKDTDLKDEDRVELLVAVINTGLYVNREEESEEEGKITGGNQHLLVDDDRREIGKKAAWSVSSCKPDAHSARVKSVVVLTKNDGGGDADDPYLVASTSSDGVIRVWDVRMAVKEKPISLAEAKTNSRLTCLSGSSIKCEYCSFLISDFLPMNPMTHAAHFLRSFVLCISVRSPIAKVTDPEETDLFFIPVFSLLSLIMNSGDGPVPEGGARQCSDNEMQEELVEWLEKQEYWRRNNRLDHVIMAGDPNAMLRVVDG
ncbi:hypothetical protein Patl1_12374 [Pistacia atlantica]|uniref:Uncharacterized protein n=1 Tax=Pistacia atlantica TaxID=434234 RepID=A0ACC1A419_9ROSI|nr:hypothetical protein Patl1_12374 [Pistacia atlantica]